MVMETRLIIFQKATRRSGYEIKSELDSNTFAYVFLVSHFCLRALCGCYNIS